MTQPTKASVSKIHWPTFWALFLVLGFGALVTRTQDGMETFKTVFKGLFSLVSTPFLLEGISMVIMGFIVAGYNRWKRERQVSDWVVMPIVEEDAESLSSESVTSAMAKIRESLETKNYEAAYQEVKSLGTLPTDASSILTIAEALGKNCKVDEAMDVIQIHQRQFPSSQDEAERNALFNEISQWLAQQRTALAQDSLPRWHQLKVLQNTPLKA